MPCYPEISIISIQSVLHSMVSEMHTETAQYSSFWDDYNGGRMPFSDISPVTQPSESQNQPNDTDRGAIHTRNK